MSRHRSDAFLPLQRSLQAVVDLWMPPACNFCGRPIPGPGKQPMLCEECRVKLQAFPGRACQRCAAPIPQHEAGDDCPRCRNRRYRFRQALAMGVYRGQLREAVIRMKRQTEEGLALSVGYLLAAAVRHVCETPGGPELIVAVPCHWWKRLRRGTNSPDILAEAVGTALELPIGRGALYCRRRTQKQGMLSPSERFANVRGAFAASRKFDFSGAHILLIDDIMTTGATGNEASKVLRRAGASRVTLAVVARGVGQDRRDS